MPEGIRLGIELEQFESFDWRRFITNADSVPESVQKNLDSLNDLVNSGDEDGKRFLAELNRGSLSKPVTALLQYYRDMFQPEELKLLYEGIQAGQEKTGFAIKSS